MLARHCYQASALLLAHDNARRVVVHGDGVDKLAFSVQLYYKFFKCIQVHAILLQRDLAQVKPALSKHLVRQVVGWGFGYGVIARLRVHAARKVRSHGTAARAH